MKRTLLCLMLVLFSLPALANVQVKLQQLEQQAKSLNDNNNSMSEDEILASAKEARAIFNDRALATATRIRGNIIYSGFIGLLSKKSRSIAYAKKSFAALKENFELDDRSELAALAHARTVVGMSEQSWVNRKLIETSLSIDLDRELDLAEDNLALHLRNAEAKVLLSKLKQS